MKKFFLAFTIISLIFATTIIKNSTKKLDTKIFETKENIVVLKDKYELLLLDYSYLSSPSKLMEYQNTYFDQNLIETNIKNFGFIKLNKNELILIDIKNNEQ